MLLSWEKGVTNFGLYLVSLIYPLSLYLISSLLTPSSIDNFDEKNKCDLESHYFNNKNWIFGIITFGFFLAFAHNIFFGDKSFYSQTQLLRITSFVFVLILFISNSKKVHAIGSVLAMVLLILFLGLKYKPL
jgi:hypothetical protein